MPNHYQIKTIEVEQQKIEYASIGAKPDIVLVLGVGQSGRNLRTIAHHISSGIVLEALPYHYFAKDQLADAGIAAVNAVIDVARTTSQQLVHVIAESQAAPATIHAVSERRSDIASVTLLAPLGFNKSFLGNTPKARYTELMRRSRLFWKHQNQRLSLRGNRDTLYEIARHSVTRLGRIEPDYNFGANQDVSDAAQQLANSLPVTIYADKYDGLFPYDEIEPLVRHSSIRLIATNLGSHINRATPLGLAELQRVIDSLPE